MSLEIQLNQTGTHSLNITESNLQTIQRYSLFKNLVDSNGYVDESVLEKLRWHIRSMIASQNDCKELLDLCIDVIYHDKMKAYGLNNLINLYKEWEKSIPAETEEEELNEESVD